MLFVKNSLRSCCNILIITALIASTLACNDEGLMQQTRTLDISGKEISFIGQIGQQNATRANDYGFVTGDRMGIYIVDREEGSAGAVHATDNHASNVLFTFNGDSYRWSSPSTLYWTDNETAIDVYGYYPGVNYIDNPLEWSFSVQANQNTEAMNGELGSYEKSDLLWGRCSNIAPTEEPIILKYEHRLAGVRVHIEKGEGISDIEWQKLERIVFVENTILESTVNLSTGTVTCSQSNQSVAPILMLSQSNDDYRAVVIPQSVTAGKSLLSITLDGQTYTHSLNTAMVYQSGKLHNFTMTINKREESGDYEIKVADDGISPWINDEASHQFSAMSYVVVNCEQYGTLKECITKAGYDYKTIQNLKVTGELTDLDFDVLRDEMPELRHLNLRDVKMRHNNHSHWDYYEDHEDFVELYVDDEFPRNAFYGNKCIRSIVLPSSIKVIGENAFREMRLMYSTLEIPEGVTEIVGWAFSFNEYNGVELVLPSTLEDIGGWAFADCGYKCELNFTDNIKSIGGNAFGGDYGGGCPNFYGVFHVPAHLTELSEEMFSGLGSFTGELEIPQGFEVIPSRAFAVGLKNRVPLVLPLGVKRIGTGAFPRLSSIHFNDDLEVIGDAAFYASNLHFSVQLPPSLKELGHDAFLESALEGEVTIPEGCLTLGGGVFAGNEITKITLPSKLEQIPNEFCARNFELREVNIPKYVDYIGDRAFADCPSMQTIVCLNPEPPMLGDRVFSYQEEWWQGDRMNMDKVILQVPEESIEAYRHADGWSEFKNITPYRELAFNIPEIVTLDKGNTLEGIIRAQGAWEVSECPDWVTVSPMSGDYKEELTVTVKPMTTEGERSGRIYFRLKDKDYTIYTDVSQYNSDIIKEDQAIVLQKASAGAPREIPLFIVGEGYTAKDIISGQYLADMNEQMENLFSCEPYRTYRDYFTVSTAIACSPEHGLEGRTRFNSGIDHYWAVFYTDEQKVWEYAEQYAYGIDNESHNRSMVVMLFNTNQTLNTVKLEDDGYSLAMVGKSTDVYPFDQRCLILRDVGGRAFGHLASEAISHYTFIKSCICPGCRAEADYFKGKSNGWYQNIALSGKMNEAPWSHLIFHPIYSAQVDMYEGAYNHARGTYRSENMSVMGNVPVPYFNTISREIIVRRIKECAGETFSFDAFVANDKMELPEDNN